MPPPSRDAAGRDTVPTPRQPDPPSRRRRPLPRPAGRRGTPVHENDVAWAPAAPVVARRRPRRAAAAGSAGRPRSRSSRSSSARRRPSPRCSPASSSTSTVLGYVPANTIVYGEVRLDLPGDQRRAVGEFLSKFPGFADQACARQQARRGPRPARQGRLERRADLHRRHQAVVRRRARVQRRAAARRAQRSSTGDASAMGDVPGPRPAVDQGPDRRRRRGSTRRSRRRARRRRPRRTTARPSPSFARDDRPEGRLRDRSTARSPSLGDVDLGQGRHRHQGQQRLRRRSPARRPRSTAADGDHVGFVYVGAPAAARLVDRAWRRRCRQALAAPPRRR